MPKPIFQQQAPCGSIQPLAPIPPMISSIPRSASMVLEPISMNSVMPWDLITWETITVQALGHPQATRTVLCSRSCPISVQAGVAVRPMARDSLPGLTGWERMASSTSRTRRCSMTSWRYSRSMAPKPQRARVIRFTASIPQLARRQGASMILPAMPIPFCASTIPLAMIRLISADGARPVSST